MARSFNGTSDSVAAGAVATSAVDNITMACWVNSSATNGNKFIIYNGGNSSGYGLTIDAGAGNKVAIDLDNVTTLDSTTVLTNGTWTHLAIVRNTTWTFYVNGVSSSLGSNAPVSPAGFASVANRFSGGFWAGSVADAAIWTTPLSSGNITSLFNGVRPINVNSANLVLWWPLDGYASPETDLSGSGLNGTLTGTSQIIGPPALWRISG